ncbi:MAG: photosynthetic complex putative assembly protein PuhB [Paracoccaceae bacterium]
MSHDDFAIEPIPGLPERPPQGEEILWQGRPNWWALAKSACGVGWVAGYFVALTLWRFIAVSDLMPLDMALAASVPFLILGAVACGLLMLFAYLQARTTVYTITTSRVAMRIGAALTVTLNLPFTRVDSADLDLRRDGSGTIALTLQQGATQLGYLVCWPHVRPWRFRTQPALRCIPDAERVAKLLGEAAQARIDQPKVTRASRDPNAPALAAE